MSEAGSNAFSLTMPAFVWASLQPRRNEDGTVTIEISSMDGFSCPGMIRLAIAAQGDWEQAALGHALRDAWLAVVKAHKGANHG